MRESREEVMTDREKIRAAFRELEENGISARGDFACCGSCGHAELGQENNQYVFWHAQEEDRVWGGYRYGELVETLHIQFSDGGTARDTTRTLVEHGLNASWNGDEGRCIEVQRSRERDAETEQMHHYVVEIREFDSNEGDLPFHEVDCKRVHLSTAEKVERGMNINLNHERFYTRIVVR